VGFSENEILIDRDICEKEFEIKPKEISLEELKTETIIDQKSKKEAILKLELPLIKIPKGKVSQILGLLNYIQSKFDDVEIKIVAQEGSIGKDDYENKIKEALKQLGIDLDKK
jgi:hypothetical protein